MSLQALIVFQEHQCVFRRVQIELQDGHLFFLEFQIKALSAPVFNSVGLEFSPRRESCGRLSFRYPRTVLGIGSNPLVAPVKGTAQTSYATLVFISGAITGGLPFWGKSFNAVFEKPHKPSSAIQLWESPLFSLIPGNGGPSTENTITCAGEHNISPSSLRVTTWSISVVYRW